MHDTYIIQLPTWKDRTLAYYLAATEEDMLIQQISGCILTVEEHMLSRLASKVITHTHESWFTVLRMCHCVGQICKVFS